MAEETVTPEITAEAPAEGKKSKRAEPNPDVMVQALVTEMLRPGVEGVPSSARNGSRFKLPKDMADVLESAGKVKILE